AAADARDTGLTVEVGGDALTTTPETGAAHHPSTGDVLETMGRVHPDKRIAKDARKAAFKARSR
ncbi:hypothetical protein ABZ686_30305, partial [Streptomyces sp. NPDC006992]|uniref:hypothetical protein n=1 Tax=Streptomyces sp. NPDC006992 TaxID=3155601 RepID=UPI0033F03524